MKWDTVMSRSLITGGLGFMGSHLARQLLEKGQEVIIFDALSGSRLIEDIKQKVEVIRGDLSNWVEVLDAVKSSHVDCIYHLGAMVSEAAEERPANAYMVNASGTFHILEAARLFDTSAVIFASTTATFGPGSPKMVHDDTVQRPASMYGVTKAFAEGLGGYYHRRYGVNFRGVRFPTILGPGRRAGFTAYASLMVEKLALGIPFTVPISEATKMAVLYYKDAVLSLIGLDEAGDARLGRRVYNVQSFSTTMRELADAVKSCLPEAQIQFRPSEEMIGMPAQIEKLDDTNAQQDWGWKPRYGLEKAVEDFVAEIRANRALYESR